MLPDGERLAIVAGAGIAGLITALSLAKAGYRVQIFEQAARLDPIGAGLQLSPNALSVLDQLGLSDVLSRVSVSAQAVILRSGRSGHVLARVPVASASGQGYRALLRADLQSVLLEAVAADPSIELRLGHELNALNETPDGLRASFAAAGETVDVMTSILVAADGIHSAAARLMDYPAPAASGMVAHRFAVDAASSESSHEIEAWLGRRRHAVSYPVTTSGARNLVLITPASDEGTMAFGTWDSALRDLVHQSTALGTWPLLTVDSATRATISSRVVFVGDAGHAMLPYAAQGAAMAIEDGWILAACLHRSNSVPEAIARFAAARGPRIDRVRKRVALHRLVYHLPFPLSFGRNGVLALRSPASLRSELGWLYDWEAPPLSPTNPERGPDLVS